jgi:hypothetical protein
MKKNTKLTKRGKVVVAFLTAIIIAVSVYGTYLFMVKAIDEVIAYQEAGADYAEEMREVRYQTLTLEEKMALSEN